MKSIGEKELDKVLSVFKDVHHEKEKLHVSDTWQANAMRLIRNHAGASFKIVFFDFFQGVVWKLAPVSCILVLLLGFLMTQSNTLTDYELAKIFINDPSDLSFISLYNG